MHNCTGASSGGGCGSGTRGIAGSCTARSRGVCGTNAGRSRICRLILISQNALIPGRLRVCIIDGVQAGGVCGEQPADAWLGVEAWNRKGVLLARAGSAAAQWVEGAGEQGGIDRRAGRDRPAHWQWRCSGSSKLHALVSPEQPQECITN